jgi:tricorn protease
MALEIGNEGKKPERILPDVRSFELSANGQKILVRKENEFYIIDAAPTPPAKLAESHVDLGAWHYSINVREDLHQMFVDAWRLHRDYFYDRNMHDVNWVAMREKYEPLVKRVTSRSELNDLLAQMVGELSVLHSAVRGGDLRKGADQITVPSLGARLDRDENKGGTGSTLSISPIPIFRANCRRLPIPTSTFMQATSLRRSTASRSFRSPIPN